MYPSELEIARARAGLTQADMAKEMGLSPRSYQDIENASERLRKRHRLAVERVLLSRAIELNDPMLAPASVRNEALALAAALSGTAKPAKRSARKT